MLEVGSLQPIRLHTPVVEQKQAPNGPIISDVPGIKSRLGQKRETAFFKWGPDGRRRSCPLSTESEEGRGKAKAEVSGARATVSSCHCKAIGSAQQLALAPQSLVDDRAGERRS
ncbi:hypothetical protein NDU88_006099 [Pleurodeles waltl]|uniref:Uncharacterized protein n=1 Tax=Pleurodeles waltl TaxID=8319 RepID=A0AAV7TCD4_PLEWA|nr:hypothetical protein NDU88_006099 [Pleurodeles waltl]